MTPEKHQLEQYRRDSARAMREHKERKHMRKFFTLGRTVKAPPVQLTSMLFMVGLVLPATIFV